MDLVHVHTTRAESDKKKNLPLDLASETRTKIEQIQMHQSSSTRIQSTHVLCFERQREEKKYTTKLLSRYRSRRVSLVYGICWAGAFARAC